MVKLKYNSTTFSALNVCCCKFALNFPSLLPRPGLLPCIISINSIISCPWKTAAAQEVVFAPWLAVVEPDLWQCFLDFLVLAFLGGSSLSHLSYQYNSIYYKEILCRSETTIPLNSHHALLRISKSFISKILNYSFCNSMLNRSSDKHTW